MLVRFSAIWPRMSVTPALRSFVAKEVPSFDGIVGNNASSLEINVTFLSGMA